MKIDLIAGTRPNFIKIAPLIDEIKRVQSLGADLQFRLVHTGQHYDRNMSGNFFDTLGIPLPDVNLNAGGGTQAEQTAKIMVGYERILMDAPTDLCVVVGDVTSTMATTITAKKSEIKVAHIEAGIRSGDMSMPEEINRIVTDALSDYFFTTTLQAGSNLKKAGITDNRIFFVGNTMIDTLVKHKQQFTEPAIWKQANLKDGNFIVITLHRPANVDNQKKLEELLTATMDNSRGLPVIFPAHPRTLPKIEGIKSGHPNLHVIEPLGYLEFNYLVERAKAVVTDSGGITEETTVMGIPCMTLRENTERPETISIGTNELLGTDPKNLKPAMNKLFSGKWKKGKIPELWDGLTSRRIIEIILKLN